MVSDVPKCQSFISFVLSINHQYPSISHSLSIRPLTYRRLTPPIKIQICQRSFVNTHPKTLPFSSSKFTQSLTKLTSPSPYQTIKVSNVVLCGHLQATPHHTITSHTPKYQNQSNAHTFIHNNKRHSAFDTTIYILICRHPSAHQ